MTLEEAIAGHMVNIDALLSVRETPLRTRPTDAAFMFVEECVLEVHGDDKADFAAKPWFAIIYHHVERWYREHYGPALNREADTAAGMLLVREVPVEVRVPLTKSRIEVPGETAWLTFPIQVEDDEDPLTWLVAPPNLDRLSGGEREQLLEDTTSVANALRSIQMNFMGIEPKDDTAIGLLEGVRAEFESAARHILRNDTNGRGSALWALQMAVERTLKAFSQHKSGSFRQIHNLFELFDDVAAYGPAVDRNLLKKLPRDTTVMADRYGLGGTPSLWEVVAAYRATLSIVSGFSRAFKRKINIGGGSFLIRKAPWVTLPPASVPTDNEDGTPK